ncbi:acyltransferase [Moraxella nasibovis]|uniref:acyltransferase n=1 Tax=Moraxella nasibovis TaxID=2904120 RepID=UPI00240FB69E|nr:acyltransferase [Moraxella nasibovis]WFF39531.1 acyltransferase [Moraxella nasibovis]
MLNKKIKNKIAHKLMKYYQKWRIAFYKIISNNKHLTLKNCRLNQPVQFVGNGKIKLDHVEFGVFPSPKFLSTYGYIEARNNDDIISINSGTIFNNQVEIIADKANIYIGKNCLIGLNFTAINSDFHGLAIQNRTNSNYLSADIKIGDNVFIGNNVTILKGVSIGDNCVIANGSIVTKSMPANSIIAGVPAHFIREIPGS